MAGTQGRAVRSGEEADGRAGKGGGQNVPFRRSIGRVVMGDRIAVLRPVEAWHGRDCGSGGVEPAERLFEGQQPSGIGGTRLAGADGVREERPNGGAQRPYGFEALFVGRPGFATRRVAEHTAPLVHPVGQPVRGVEVVGDNTTPVVVDGEGEVERKPGVEHKANGSFDRGR